MLDENHSKYLLVLQCGTAFEDQGWMQQCTTCHSEAHVSVELFSFDEETIPHMPNDEIACIASKQEMVHWRTTSKQHYLMP
jgi:hypothetical protein